MEVNLVIPRHKYRSLDGIRPESLSLSPEGKAALDRLATCSRSAAADLAIRVLDAAIFGDCEQVESMGHELAGMLGSIDDLGWACLGFGNLEAALNKAWSLKIPTT